MGVFQFLNNEDVCFFGDARRVNFHQPLFPHYTGRVFNIQVGGSLKGANFGNHPPPPKNILDFYGSFHPKISRDYQAKYEIPDNLSKW